MGQEHKRNWKCPECCSKRPKADNTNTPVRTAGSTCDNSEKSSRNDAAYGDMNVTVRSKTPKQSLEDSEMSSPECIEQCTDPVSREQEPPSAHDFGMFWKEMRCFRLELNQFRNTMKELTNTVKKYNEKLESLEERVQSLETKVINKSDLYADMETTIAQLKQDIQDRDQAILSNDLEIAGIPEGRTENVTHIVLTVANKLGVDLDERDIVVAERVGQPRALIEGEAPRPRPISVRLAQRSRRSALLQAARVKRGATTEGLGMTGTPRHFYVNERLTKQNRQIFQKARELASRHKWRYVWTRDGKIYVRREHGAERHIIRTEIDLTRVFGVDAV